MALRGHIDHLSRRQMIGWAQDADAPESPVSLVVSVDGRVVGRCLADRPRDDLVQAGQGHGRHGFDFAFPIGALPALARCTVAVRRDGDGVMLPGAPRALDPIAAFDEDLQGRLALALAEPVDDAERDRRLGFLLEQTQLLRQAHADRHGRAAGIMPAVAASAAPRPRALVVDAMMPNAKRDAGSNAILSHMRSLQRLGYAVTFAPIEAGVDGNALEAEGIACCLHPWYATLEEVLRRNAGTFALVYLHRIASAGRYGQLVRDTQPGARLVYSVADLSHLRTARQAAVEGRADLAAYAEHLQFLELTAARAADAVITHSTHEAEILRRHVPAERVHVVPWTVALRPTAVPFAERRGMAFIGGYTHRPNVDAAHRLIQTIVPAVRVLGADIPCLLVGSGMPDTLRSLASARLGVEAIGSVASLASVFDWVRLTVAPLAYGAGVKGKVLDSLAAGVPCVCTPVAAEGIDLPEPLAGLVADTPDGLARSIAALHADEALNRACAEAGLAFVSERLGEARLDALMRVVTDRGTGAGAQAPAAAVQVPVAPGAGPPEKRSGARQHVALLAVGTHGDVLPLVALGHALAARGHGVSLAAPAPFEAIVRRAGLAFQPLGTVADYEALIRDTDLWHPRRGFRPVFAYAASLAETACLWLGAIQARTPGLVVVASPLAWGARIAQDLYGLPTATLHVMPFLIESALDPPRLPGGALLHALPRWTRPYVRFGVDTFAAHPVALPPLNALRARFGLPPVKRLRHWWNSPDRLLLMFPDWYAPRATDWPQQAMQIGFALADRFGDAGELPPELTAFLDAGAPPLVFTYGSAMRASLMFFQTAVAVCRAMGRRGVLLASQDGQIPEDLPPEVIHVPYAPLSVLLPRCAALIHHGGIGTVAQSLAAGVPQLVVPVAFNHFDDGQRLSRCDLGAVLSRRAFQPNRVARVLDRLLRDPAVARACARAKVRLAADDALGRTCDAVEALAALGPRKGHPRRPAVP